MPKKKYQANSFWGNSGARSLKSKEGRFILLLIVKREGYYATKWAKRDFIRLQRYHRAQKAEEALYKSEEMFRLLITNIRDVVYSVDVETKEFNYLSPTFERITGYSLEDIKKMGGRQLF